MPMDAKLSEALAKAAAAERQAEEQKRAQKRPQNRWWTEPAAERRAAVAKNWRSMLEWIVQGKASRDGALEAFLSVYGTEEYGTLNFEGRTRTIMFLHVELARALLAKVPVPRALADAYRVWARGHADASGTRLAAEAARRVARAEPALREASAVAKRAHALAEKAAAALAKLRAEQAAELETFNADNTWLKRRLTPQGREEHAALLARHEAAAQALVLEATESRSAAELADGEELFAQDELRSARAELERVRGRAVKAEADLLAPVGFDATEGQPLSLVDVPAGRGWMGTADFGSQAKPEETPLRRVDLTVPFQVAVYPVTQILYLTVAGDDPSRFPHPLSPVNRVSWYDACRFCNALSDLCGLERAYHIEDATGRVVWRRKAAGYRLPTEAEWERAARTDATFEFAGADDLRQVGWYADNSRGTPRPVGALRPNPLGLYDCSGNVWEWCHDGYAADQYRRSEPVDPLGPDDAPTRVIRGGSASNVEERCRVAARGDAPPEGVDVFLGFRVVRNATG